ncbi:hypothetical protein B0H19DRAFT_520411 [Mycena capillaripes]|nr:hypothetical protein B0H19DRAFT_520411 [Mycena capillaripes]
MDRPLGPRQPPERHAAYEDIFGRRPTHAPQQPRPPPQHYNYPQQPQYHPYPGPAPSAYARAPPYHHPHPQQYVGPPQYGSAYLAGPPPGARAPSIRAPSLRPPYQPGVPAPPPDRPPDAQGLTPAQAYQAQVAWGHNRSPSPTPSAAPSLSVAIGGGEGLGIDFDSPGGFGGGPNGSALEVPGEEDDEDSELPWARPSQVQRESPSFPFLFFLDGKGPSVRVRVCHPCFSPPASCLPRTSRSVRPVPAGTCAYSEPLPDPDPDARSRRYARGTW